jgi:8-oxo-dGTP diphosphatase
MEETGITVHDIVQFDLAEIILRDVGGAPSSHHVVIVFRGTADATNPVAGDDAAEARFVPAREAASLRLTADVRRILARLPAP